MASKSRNRIHTPRHASSARAWRSLGLHLACSFLVIWIALCGCARQQDAVDRIQAAGVLRVALDPAFPPFEYVDETGMLVGLDVDLARELAARLGVEAHFVSTGYDALYDALTVERADIIISALYPDPSRTHAFAFSTPYFNAGEVLIVRENSPIGGVDDLAGRELLIVYGTNAHIEAMGWEQTLSPPPVLLTGDTPATITSALAAGYADAVLLDHVSARISTAQTPGLHVLAPPINDEPYVVAARIEDRHLIDVIGDLINDMKEDGTLEALIQQWLGG